MPLNPLEFTMEHAQRAHPFGCPCSDCQPNSLATPKTSAVKLRQCDFCYDMVGPGHICPEMSEIKITPDGHIDTRK